MIGSTKVIDHIAAFYRRTGDHIGAGSFKVTFDDIVSVGSEIESGVLHSA